MDSFNQPMTLGCSWLLTEGMYFMHGYVWRTKVLNPKSSLENEIGLQKSPSYCYLMTKILIYVCVFLS